MNDDAAFLPELFSRNVTVGGATYDVVGTPAPDAGGHDGDDEGEGRADGASLSLADLLGGLTEGRADDE